MGFGFAMLVGGLKCEEEISVLEILVRADEKRMWTVERRKRMRMLKVDFYQER